MKYMPGKNGAYIASFSAVDGDDVEGGYYLWSGKELREVLQGEMLELALKHWNLQSSTGDDHAAHAGQQRPRAGCLHGRSEQQVEELLQQARQKLLARRAERVLPKDDKELAGWNGLLLSALSIAARQPGMEDMRLAAKQLRDKLMTRLWDGNNLLRARDDKGSMGAAALEDYAYVAYGLARWADLSGK